MSPQLLRSAGSYFFEGSPVGCLLVHGMGSTPYQVHSLGDYLAWQGLTVLGIRLPGHETTLDELEQTTAGQWLTALEEGIDQLQQICEHIFVIGNSLGGVLTLAIAARRGQDLAGIVTINTPVSATMLIGLLEDPTVPDRFVRPNIAEVLCSDPRVGTFQYPQQSKKVLAEAYEVFKENQAHLSQIHIPILVIISRKDRTVPLENAHYLIEPGSSTDTTLLTLNDSAHLPTLAPIVKICGNFLIASAMEEISQALDLAEKNGLDRMTFVNMLTQSLFACSVYQDYAPMIAQEQDRFPPLWELLKSLTKLLDTK